MGPALLPSAWSYQVARGPDAVTRPAEDPMRLTEAIISRRGVAELGDELVVVPGSSRVYASSTLPV